MPPLILLSMLLLAVGLLVAYWLVAGLLSVTVGQVLFLVLVFIAGYMTGKNP